MRQIRHALAGIALLFSGGTNAAVTTLPRYRSGAGIQDSQGVVILNPDGTPAASSGGAEAPATSTPLTGSFSAAGTSAAFTPQLGRAITVTLSGTWTGSIQLLRSRDGGVTKLPITYGDGTVKGVWTTNVNAIVTVETVAGATYYLQAASGFSGSAAYTVEN